MSRPRRSPSPRRRPHRGSPGGPHELGQNLLVDRRFPAAMSEILRHAPPHPVLELGAGDGALTRALVALGPRVTAVELDPRRVERLRARFAGRVEVVQGDLLTHRFGPGPMHVVSNVPFSLTTPLLRRLVAERSWHTAVLLLQWEVARKRAAIGGTTLFTAAWWPWFEFTLGPRVPAAAFRPRPAVDGGILVIRRREPPRLEETQRRGYQALVRRAFTGRGTTLPQLLGDRLGETAVRRLLTREGLPARAGPRDLAAEHWLALHELGRR